VSEAPTATYRTAAVAAELGVGVGVGCGVVGATLAAVVEAGAFAAAAVARDVAEGRDAPAHADASDAMRNREAMRIVRIDNA
jgi:hypothetical protein